MVKMSQSISSVTEEGTTEYDDHCTICLEDLISKVREMPCKHRFHSPCIESWLLRSESCPLCRRPFLSGSNLSRRLWRLVYAYFANVLIIFCWITGWLCAWLIYLNLAICPVISSVCPLYPFEKATWIISSLFLVVIVFLVTIHPCPDDRRGDQVIDELEGNLRTQS
ncbi:putative transcription factor C2H2 family [Rosa chinensis]|uniref:Putative transcription factor C2H2 family n=1 Tax=Rosa chinensis TaxID=74649 RepID=A0A2P6S4I5_ROSCH|nr:putative transcription factor C2H2 family [Rosa chinensis]